MIESGEELGAPEPISTAKGNFISKFPYNRKDPIRNHLYEFVKLSSTKGISEQIYYPWALLLGNMYESGALSKYGRLNNRVLIATLLFIKSMGGNVSGKLAFSMINTREYVKTVKDLRTSSTRKESVLLDERINTNIFRYAIILFHAMVEHNDISGRSRLQRIKKDIVTYNDPKVFSVPPNFLNFSIFAIKI